MLYPKCTRSLSTVLVPLTHRSATRPKTPGLWLELLCLAPAVRAAASRCLCSSFGRRSWSPVLYFHSACASAPAQSSDRARCCRSLSPHGHCIRRRRFPPRRRHHRRCSPCLIRRVHLASISDALQVHLRSISDEMQMCLPVRGLALSESSGSCSSCACSYALQVPLATAVPAVSRRPTTLHRARVQ